MPMFNNVYETNNNLVATMEVIQRALWYFWLDGGRLEAAATRSFYLC